MWPCGGRVLVYLASTGPTGRWWTPGYGRAGAAPCLTCNATAGRARALDALPEAEALRAGLAEAARLLGRAGLPAACAAARRVSWAADPLAGGGYAHVPPGADGAREALAAPEWGGALLWAGEATAFDR